MFSRSLALLGLAVASGATLTSSLLDTADSVLTEFRSAVLNDTGIRYVKNSGVCETTPGVEQISGYIDVGTNMSMWFWFFESRNEPETAPFTLWLNGGPGCSSMIGLFQEHGPCLVNADANSTYLNPYSWNNVSNMIYIDQPIGTGFSYGTDTANSTVAAAGPVWTAFQVLFESGLFSKYASREFVYGTESYGGHYGPAFTTYFDQQNAKIASGAITGVPITVAALLINNGWIDPLIQNEAYLTFAQNAPGYGQLLSNETLKNISAALYNEGGCVDQEKACYAAGNLNASADTVCLNADNYCGNYVFSPAVGNYDPYDLRQNSTAAFPPEYYVTYLQTPAIQKKIGAQVTYEECPNPPYYKMIDTGDDAKTLLPQLGALANSGLRILIWAGDTDIICNWVGGHEAILAMDWYGNETLHNTPLTNMTLDDEPIAQIQNVDNFTFARLFGAGHEVAAFQPKAALAIFTQVIAKEPLHSV